MNRQDLATAPLAVGALAYPVIHDWIEFPSQEAQLWLPILGASWLIIQMVAKIKITWFWRK